MLEHHAHALSAECLQIGALELLNVRSLNLHSAVGDVVELVDSADRRRFAGTRKSHHNEDLALLH